MRKQSLQEVACTYLTIIEEMEKTSDKWDLILLEEKRIIWHNKFMEHLKRAGIPFKDREDVTRIAYRLVQDE